MYNRTSETFTPPPPPNLKWSKPPKKKKKKNLTPARSARPVKYGSVRLSVPVWARVYVWRSSECLCGIHSRNQFVTDAINIFHRTLTSLPVQYAHSTASIPHCTSPLPLSLQSYLLIRLRRRSRINKPPDDVLHTRPQLYIAIYYTPPGRRVHKIRTEKNIGGNGYPAVECRGILASAPTLLLLERNPAHLSRIYIAVLRSPAETASDAQSVYIGWPPNSAQYIRLSTRLTTQTWVIRPKVNPSE